MLHDMGIIKLVEDHHEALGIWRRANLKNLTLVHLDAHLDFAFYQAKPVRQIIREAENLKNLIAQLETNMLYRRYEKNFDKQLHIGNYIYPAMRDGIVDQFYWIVPGDSSAFPPDMKRLKRMAEKVTSQDPYHAAPMKMHGGSISGQLCQKCFCITNIFSIRRINKPLLLDIDIDYLLFNSATNVNLTENIEKRKPWIYPDHLVKILKEKFLNITCTTIAYSVNQGFTPIEYKFFGDEIYFRLTNDSIAPELEQALLLRNRAIESYWNDNLAESIRSLRAVIRQAGQIKTIDSNLKPRFFAHIYYWLFKVYWQNGEKVLAKRCYVKAARNDAAYRGKDNNYGSLYLTEGNPRSACAEYTKIIFCDRKNDNAFFGLGRALLQRKRYAAAEKAYTRGLRLNTPEGEDLLGLAEVYMQRGKLKKAVDILSHHSVIDPTDPRSARKILLAARLNKKLKDYQKSFTLYKEAIMLGAGSVKMYNEIFTMLKSKKNTVLLKYFAKKYNGFKNNHSAVHNTMSERHRPSNDQSMQWEKVQAQTDELLQSLTHPKNEQ